MSGKVNILDKLNTKFEIFIKNPKKKDLYRENMEIRTKKNQFPRKKKKKLDFGIRMQKTIQNASKSHFFDFETSFSNIK
jgi:hypothetical protein